MALYMVFVRNLAANQDFVVPTHTRTVNEAIGEVAKRYPGPAYTTLTCFAKTELQGIIGDAERWPGVPSVVQPRLEEVLKRVTSGTRLPPLTRASQPVQPVTGANVTQSAMEPLTQKPVMARNNRMSKDQYALSQLEGLAARLKARTEHPARQNQPAVSRNRATTAETAAGPAPSPSVVSRNSGTSVIDLLKAMRG